MDVGWSAPTRATAGSEMNYGVASTSVREIMFAQSHAEVLRTPASARSLVECIDGDAEVVEKDFLHGAMDVSEWRHLREVAFMSGDETTLLAYKMLQEMFMSPRVGLDDRVLLGLSRELSDVRQFWDAPSAQMFTTLSEVPATMAEGLTRGRDIYAKRAGDVPAEGKEEVETVGESSLDGHRASSQFVDNVQYVMEHLIGGVFDGVKDRGVDKSAIMRGRIPELSCFPRTERENGIIDVDSIVLYDPLFRRLFRGGG